MSKLIILILLAIPAISAADVFPDGNNIALKGVRAFDASAIVSSFLGVEDVINRSSLETAINDAFVLGLRRDGVEVDVAAPNYLRCYIRVGGDGPGLIVYHISIRFWDYSVAGLNTLLWETSSLYTVGSSNFNANSVAQKCVDEFASAWLEQNPK